MCEAGLPIMQPSPELEQLEHAGATATWATDRRPYLVLPYSGHNSMWRAFQPPATMGASHKCAGGASTAASLCLLLLRCRSKISSVRG